MGSNTVPLIFAAKYFGIAFPFVHLVAYAHESSPVRGFIGPSL
jgi:hypothetical protein